MYVSFEMEFLLLLSDVLNQKVTVSTFLYMQILLQECLAPVAEEVCAEITKSSGASTTPLHKIIK